MRAASIIFACEFSKIHMKTLQIKDKKFAVSISEENILKQVKRVAGQINSDFADSSLVFLCILNGSFIFAADLLREISLPAEIVFVKLASYSGDKSTGRVSEMIGLTADITDRDVIIVEDIVDSGLTMKYVTEMLTKRNPRSVSICSLLVKPANLEVSLDIRYKCFEIPNDFIVGYGLDYDSIGRNMRDIYTVIL